MPFFIYFHLIAVMLISSFAPTSTFTIFQRQLFYPLADFLLKVTDYFPFKIRAVNTDNGSEYLLNFHKTCEKLNIPHYFTYPHTPKMNGRAERLIQTVEYEFFNYQYDLLPDIDEINKRCELFNDKYNNRRYHRAISYRTPGEFVMLYLSKGGQPFSI